MLDFVRDVMLIFQRFYDFSRDFMFFEEFLC